MSNVLTHPFVAKTHLETAGDAPVFIHDGVKLRGLTKIVAQLCPCQPHTRCADCDARKDVKRQTGVARGILGTRAGRKGLVPSRTAPAAQQTYCAGPNDRAHGTLVDRQLDSLMRGIEPPVYDPCVLILLSFFRTRGWRILGSQVPIYCKSLNCATSIDVLCLNATGGLVLIEVKSTRKAPGTAESTNRCYRYVTGQRGAFSASKYMNHQIQLFCMYFTLMYDLKIPVAEAYVLRTNWRHVQGYPLRKQFRTWPNDVTHALQIRLA